MEERKMNKPAHEKSITSVPVREVQMMSVKTYHGTFIRTAKINEN